MAILLQTHEDRSAAISPPAPSYSCSSTSKDDEAASHSSLELNSQNSSFCCCIPNYGICLLEFLCYIHENTAQSGTQITKAILQHGPLVLSWSISVRVIHIRSDTNKSHHLQKANLNKEAIYLS